MGTVQFSIKLISSRQTERQCNVNNNKMCQERRQSTHQCMKRISPLLGLFPLALC